MLKFFFYVLFLIPLSYYGYWWFIFFMLILLMYMFMYSYVGLLIFGNLSYYLGCDLISYSLIMLSFWICALMIMSSDGIYFLNYYFNLFIFFVLVLFIFLYLSFCSLSLIMFYLFFESSLIPTMFLIFGWGYQPERLQAGMYFLFYTLFSSLPMLLSILYFYSFFGSLSFFLIFKNDFYYYIFYLSMIMSFLVKIPVFLVHLWLPKAHVEAPVSGSMILAGVLLKLGGYGLYRVMGMLLISGIYYNYILVGIGLLGGFYVSLICIRQSDLKSLIAYSSVSHMSLVMSGIMTSSYWGIYGSLILMLAHGLCSSGLFCLVNFVYDRLGSRSLCIIKGLLGFMPSMTLWWFFLSAYNMAAPPSLNLMGEIVLLNSLLSWSLVTIWLLMFMTFFSAVYTLYMYSYSQHGLGFSGIYSFGASTSREYLLIFLHWFPLNIIIFVSSILLI
uniref:NADH dehydrogenase subunit 4 n=1 Tax=Carausius morosus TaxID=7022 RepID=UPI0030035D5F|nr:NADH dehydrogenase subunit 4 [Carausius morosus]